jgi:hypothetical protein
MKTGTKRVVALLVVSALVLAGATDCMGATRYDWRLRFRTIRTVHFDIHAHQGEETLARRLAAIVEDVRISMQPILGVPRGRVQVILVDQTDLSNGWANPFPYDAIEITAVPPPAETLIGNTDDWIRIAFTHEYTHILHLDRTRGWMDGVRHVFGRAPFVFPNLFLPVWQIEGIATFEESQMTHEGRVPAGDFRVIVDLAAHQRRFEPYDRASGGLIDWPGGNAAYAYGAYFHQYLADRYGAERIAQLADATAGRLPFYGAPAFKRVFGQPVGDLWKGFRESREEAARSAGATDAVATRLTHDGFNVGAPRYGPDRTVYFLSADPHRFPSLKALSPDGRIRSITTRALGNRTSVQGDWLLFDQVERVRSVAVYSDLYAVHTGGGPVHRLTVEARAGDPDLSPDGRRIACTVQVGGRRALALLAFAPDRVTTPEIIVDEAETDFTGPRWSPDGRQLVVERRRRSGLYELVLVDVAARQVKPLVARASTRLVTPTWMADGRTVLFAANVDDRPFNIYAASLDEGAVRQVTDSIGGAEAPELSPDGQSFLYVGYTADGYDLFSVPIDRSAWQRTTWPIESKPAVQNHTVTGDLRPYRPWRTLRPTYWSPIAATDAGEFLVGAGTSMSDTLGRHAYGVDAAWTSSRARPDWHVAYAYDRWWPTLFAGYSDDTDPADVGESRVRQLAGGVLLPFRHIRWAEAVLGAVDFEVDTLRCDTACESVGTQQQRGSVRTGWIHDSRRQFGYSVSAEEGMQIETAVEATREALGSDADASALVFDARVFQRVIGRHTVLAARTAFAGSWGVSGFRRQFSASGPGPAVAAFDFGRDTIGLLRGFAADDLVASRAAVANLDLRVPLAYPQRGLGSWPVFFSAVHMAVFGDAGESWDQTFRWQDLRTSVGGELSVDTVIGHYVPLTFTAGGAWRRDPVGSHEGGAVFARIGHAF